MDLSRSIAPRWTRISAVGLFLSAASWGAGELLVTTLQRDLSLWTIALRLLGAFLRGAGLACTILFVMTLLAGLAFLLLDRKNLKGDVIGRRSAEDATPITSSTDGPPVLREYDVVRVSHLLRPERAYGGTESVRRPPAIGDIGTICHELVPSDQTAPVMVEMVDQNGMTVWLADFVREELELVERPRRDPAAF
jgi:hypothetical protein